MMGRNRITALFLLIVWVALAAAPAAFASQSHQCPVCRDNICPMHKPHQTQPQISCHQDGNKADGKLKARRCNQEIDPVTFEFQALLPDSAQIIHEQFSFLSTDNLRQLPLIDLQKGTPPPRT